MIEEWIVDIKARDHRFISAIFYRNLVNSHKYNLKIIIYYSSVKFLTSVFKNELRNL